MPETDDPILHVRTSALREALDEAGMEGNRDRLDADQWHGWITDCVARLAAAPEPQGDVRAELLAFVAALGRDEVAGYALARIVPCSTDEDGHVDDWEFEPLYGTDEAPLDDAAYSPILDAYAEWMNRPDLLAVPPATEPEGETP